MNQRIQDQRRKERLIEEISKYLAGIVNVKLEYLKNEQKQKQALKSAQDDREERIEKEYKDEADTVNRGNAILDL